MGSSQPRLNGGKTSSRVFDVGERYSSNISLEMIEQSQTPWVYLRCNGGSVCNDRPNSHLHFETLVVAVDGVCIPGVREGLGVYVGNSSSFNVSQGPTPGPTPPPPRREQAVLEAGLRALNLVRRISRFRECQLQELVIKSDSEYLVRGITEHITMWEVNGYKNDDGTPHEDETFFRGMDRAITRLNDKGVKVLFWLVPHSLNQKAHELASAALRR